jgi:hypothetical protein
MEFNIKVPHIQGGTLGRAASGDDTFPFSLQTEHAAF